MFGVGHGGEDLGLFVAALVVAQVGGVLLEGLAHAGDVAVSEDAPYPGEEGVFDAVAADALGGEVFDEGLGHGETLRCHAGVLSAG